MATNGRPLSLTDQFDLSDSLNINSANEKSSFRKWFQWCINALSFHCLRQQKHSRHSKTNDVRASEFLHVQPLCTARQTQANVETIGTRQLSDPLAFCGYADAFQTNMVYSTLDEPRAAERRVEPQAEVLHAPVPDTPKKQGPWSNDEHKRYCEGLEMFRFGSWKLIANYVGTRSERQVMSHAQSIRAKRKRAEEREQREKDLGSSSHKNARTGDARTQMLSAEELLVVSMSMPLPATITMRSGVASLSPTLAGVFDFEMPFHEQVTTSATQTEEQNSMLSTEECPKPLVRLDLGVCSPPLDILVEKSFSDEEIFDLLDLPSNVSVAW